jgi:c-di-GMP-binding flagellar brake protein YcgR
MSEGTIRKDESGKADFYSEVKASKDIIPLRLTPKDRKMMEIAREILEQPKDSTLIKQLARIGFNAIHDRKTKLLLGMVFENKRKNKRLGVMEFEA